VDALAAFRTDAVISVWLKLDSGMHRLGLSPDAFRVAHAQLSALPHVGPLVLMSHFARADELGSPRTREQLAVFQRAIEGLAGETALCNSPALLGWPQLRSDWVRPGLMLYGADPLYPQPSPHAGQLRPVMTLESKVIAVRELAVGDPLGYGARFVAQRPTRVGVVAMGYADGYPQFAPNGTPVLIDELAPRCGTSAYRLPCSLKRAERVYLQA
jgi:alanine racemase